jgi:hypothetical protein
MMPTAGSSHIVKVIREGDVSKANPFTIVAVSNPCLETPWRSGVFAIDPITSDRALFDGCVEYIHESLFGALPGQAENLLAEESIGPFIRLVSLFIDDLSVEDTNALVAQDDLSNLVIARRTAVRPLLAKYGLSADVVYAVTASKTHSRASAWFTTDDDSQGGVSFTLDGQNLSHRYHSLVPGTVALPATSTSLTALHEFCHALSSYSNGMVVDLYVDANVGLNNRRGRPIPPVFSTYNGITVASDPERDGLGYPRSWQSYHGALVDSTNPAIMDDYWRAASGPESCRHDQITRQFLMDRMRAKISRP